MNDHERLTAIINKIDDVISCLAQFRLNCHPACEELDEHLFYIANTLGEAHSRLCAYYNALKDLIGSKREVYVVDEYIEEFNDNKKCLGNTFLHSFRDEVERSGREDLIEIIDSFVVKQIRNFKRAKSEGN